MGLTTVDRLKEVNNRLDIFFTFPGGPHFPKNSRTTQHVAQNWIHLDVTLITAVPILTKAVPDPDLKRFTLMLFAFFLVA